MIVFDESHFGIVETGSIVALARRFRLHGLALGLAICRRAIHLAERLQLSARGRPRRQLKRSPAAHRVAGLVTLLRRHIAPDRLAAACWQEWLKSPTRDFIDASAQARAARGGPPAAALREIQAIVHAKGAL